jgi:antitoxin component of RelBE/YafQ-DinJ toxin-antitoxin module
METRIQFRIDAQTKELAQKAAHQKGMTLSDACRQFAERLAEEQQTSLCEAAESNDWIRAQVEKSFAALDRGELIVLSEDEARDRILKKREEILKKFGRS